MAHAGAGGLVEIEEERLGERALDGHGGDESGAACRERSSRRASRVWINWAIALNAISYARAKNIPMLGTCGGFQYTVIELARSLLGIAGAQHAETHPEGENLVVEARWAEMRYERFPALAAELVRLQPDVIVEDNVPCFPAVVTAGAPWVRIVSCNPCELKDAAVPPEKLGSYLRDYARLLKIYHYTSALYGHFGQGCVHNRVDFDLKSREGIKKFRAFMEEAADIVVGYGGSISGEHGDGQARAELLQGAGRA